MKYLTVALAFCVISLSVSASIAGDPVPHPLYGKWGWVYARNNCQEIYHFRGDNTSAITSAEEVAESHFTVSEKPDANGFYRMTDVVTQTNGLTGCDGTPGGTPVGDTVTLYLLFNSLRSEMLMCQEPSLKACMGPLHRLSE
jgi:hypothetical protein